MTQQDTMREMLRRFDPKKFVTWVYRKGRDKRRNVVWSVGYYTITGSWVQDSVHYERGSASGRVRFLNGG